MSDNYLWGLVAVICGVVVIVFISLIAAEDMFFDDRPPFLPNCTEDEVISYRNFDDPDTLFCLHIDNIFGLQPEVTPVASSWAEEPSD